jgi:hypothetical protein
MNSTEAVTNLYVKALVKEGNTVLYDIEYVDFSIIVPFGCRKTHFQQTMCIDTSHSAMGYHDFLDWR